MGGRVPLGYDHINTALTRGKVFTTAPFSQFAAPALIRTNLFPRSSEPIYYPALRIANPQ
jgi:hypothetical protein